MLGMVEKVARAICRSMLQDPDIDYEVHHQDGLVKGWKMYESEAKAAIEAMREPTEPMLDAGVRHHNNDKLYLKESVSCQWDAMIDAALGEE